MHEMHVDKYYYVCYVCGKAFGVDGIAAFKKILPGGKKVYVCKEHKDDKNALSSLCSKI